MRKTLIFLMPMALLACEARLGYKTSSPARTKNAEPAALPAGITHVSDTFDASASLGSDHSLYINPTLAQSLTIPLKADLDSNRIKIIVSRGQDCRDAVDAPASIKDGKLVIDLSQQNQNLWLCMEWQGQSPQKLDPIQIVIDRDPPEAPVVTGLPSSYSRKTDLALSLSAQDVAYVRYALIAGSSSCQESQLAAWVTFNKDIFVTDQGAKGERVFCIQGRDQAGNLSTVRQYNWKKMDYPYIKISTIRKSSANPVVTTGAPLSSDDNRYLLGWGSFYNIWTITSFADSNHLYLIGNCKYGDAGSEGWHGCVASCTTSLSCSWIDRDTGTSGMQALINKFGTNTVTGNQLGDVKMQKFAFDETGKLMGIGMLGLSSDLYPVKANNFASLSNMSYMLNNVATNSLAPATVANTWKGSFSFPKSGVYAENGNFYLFMSSINSPANTEEYLSITSSTNMTSFTTASNYVAKNLTYPYISKVGDAYIMIAFSRTQQRWVALVSESLTSWDESKATVLELGSYASTNPSDWDYEGFTGLASDFSQPEIQGAHALSNKSLYLFYRAGFKDYTAATAPYGVKRDIGAFVIDWDFME